jgi:hypothetical protein
MPVSGPWFHHSAGGMPQTNTRAPAFAMKATEPQEVPMVRAPGPSPQFLDRHRSSLFGRNVLRPPAASGLAVRAHAGRAAGRNVALQAMAVRAWRSVRLPLAPSLRLIRMEKPGQGLSSLGFP